MGTVFNINSCLNCSLAQVGISLIQYCFLQSGELPPCLLVNSWAFLCCPFHTQSWYYHLLLNNQFSCWVFHTSDFRAFHNIPGLFFFFVPTCLKRAPKSIVQKSIKLMRKNIKCSLCTVFTLFYLRFTLRHNFLGIRVVYSCWLKNMQWLKWRGAFVISKDS